MSTTTAKPKPMIGPRQTAKLTGLSDGLIRQEFRKGSLWGIPVLRAGNRYVISRKAVEHIVNGGTTNAT